MKNLSTGLVAGLVVLSLVVILGATKNARTTSEEVAIGTFNCTASATGELSTSLVWEGTAGVVGEPEGLSLDIVTVTEAPADSSCQLIADDILELAEASGCTATRVRAIINSRDFSMVCTGFRNEVIETVGLTSKRLAEVIP